MYPFISFISYIYLLNSSQNLVYCYLVPLHKRYRGGFSCRLLKSGSIPDHSSAQELMDAAVLQGVWEAKMKRNFSTIRSCCPAFLLPLYSLVCSTTNTPILSPITFHKMSLDNSFSPNKLDLTLIQCVLKDLVIFCYIFSCSLLPDALSNGWLS